jgi:hypothetical protein
LSEGDLASEHSQQSDHLEDIVPRPHSYKLRSLKEAEDQAMEDVEEEEEEKKASPDQDLRRSPRLASKPPSPARRGSPSNPSSEPNLLYQM